MLGHRTVPDLDCTAPVQLSHFSKQLEGSDRGTVRRVLLAYSMGARLALLHACESPDFWDAIILISCHPGIKDAIERIEREKADVALACSIEKKGLAWFLPYWQSLPVIQSQVRAPADFRIKMEERKKKLSPHGIARCLRQFGQGSVRTYGLRLSVLSALSSVFTELKTKSMRPSIGSSVNP